MKNACKNAYLGSIFIPEKYVIRVLFVNPWMSPIPPLAIRVGPPGCKFITTTMIYKTLISNSYYVNSAFHI